MASHTLLDSVSVDFARNTAIIEIGSARESSGPESSTFYFREMARRLGAEFYSVDFAAASNALAHEIVGDAAVLSDGAQFLREFRERSRRPISILYLDNFDVVYNDKHRASLTRRVGTVYEDHNEQLTNERSAAVHLEQTKVALPLMSEPHVIVFDDTMIRDGKWWGKGATGVPFLLGAGYEIRNQSEDGVLLVSPAFPKGSR